MLILIPVVKHGCSKKRKKEPDRTFDDISIAAKFYVGQKRRSGDFEILVLRKAQSGGENKCPDQFFYGFQKPQNVLEKYFLGFTKKLRKVWSGSEMLFVLSLLHARPTISEFQVLKFRRSRNSLQSFEALKFAKCSVGNFQKNNNQNNT